MVKLVFPWLLTLLLGFVVFLFGKYLQRIEKERRDEQAALRQQFTKQMESALSKMQPADQKPAGEGIAGMQGQSQQQRSNWPH
jgi:hypothetical protein